MADRPPQSYASHAHRPHLTNWAGLLTLLAFLFSAAEAWRRPGALAIGLLLLTVAVALLVAISRIYIVRLQDRIIRLEMRLRLERLGRAAAYERLSTRQLVALRFASDAELPALVDLTLEDNLSSKQIKEAVREWQPDYHRT